MYFALYRRSRGWFIRRRPAKVKPTVARSRTNSQYNHGYPYGLSRTSSNGCQWRYKYGRYGLRCIKTASTTTTKAPVQIRAATTTSGPGIYINPRSDKESIFKHFVIPVVGLRYCPNVKWLFLDVLTCGPKNNALYPLSDANYTEVFSKVVVKVQIVERPMGYCGLVRSWMYNRWTISCLNTFNMKTSMSQKKDRVMHSGIVIETADREKYLIHKGKFFKGKNKNDKTVIQKVEEAMFNNAYTKVGRNFTPRQLRKVREYYDESGTGYNFITDNCHDGTIRMINLAKNP